jgi:hypothetical protein
MRYTTLGRIKLRVSVAGLGGFSRLGLKTGKTERSRCSLTPRGAIAWGRACP